MEVQNKEVMKLSGMNSLNAYSHLWLNKDTQVVSKEIKINQSTENQRKTVN